MINILPNNQCKMINIVWIERGIILTIIYYIIKKFNDIRNKTIIIDNQRYIDFFKVLFPTIKFSKFKKHKSQNFYFNIRNIIKKQDIVIDYLDNYDNTIRTNKISLIPWFDMNDILITYEYDKNKNMNCNKIKKYIKEFSYCKRGNYNNQIWDSYVENYIFKKIAIFYKDIDINLLINYFNNFVKSNYTNMVIEKPKIYYVEKPNESNSFNIPNNGSNYNGSINTGSINTGSINTGPNYNGSNYNGSNYTGSNHNGSNYTGSNYTRSNYTGSNKPSKLYCEYDADLVNKISNIYLGMKMINVNGVIDIKINALKLKIDIMEHFNGKGIYDESIEINILVKDFNFQLDELLKIKEGINNKSKLDDLLKKLSYKNNS